jgi:hypothetical protein
MIYLDMGGRCGNQFFQYAFVRTLKEEYQDDLTIDFYRIHKKEKTDPTWEDCLQYFNVGPYESIDLGGRKIINEYGNFRQRLVYACYLLVCILPYRDKQVYYRRQMKLQPLLNHFGLYWLSHGYTPVKKTKMKNKFVCGTFENVNYFDSMQSVLWKELTGKEPLSKQNEALYQNITEKQSVCISIRRGDFLKKEYSTDRDICDYEYYQKAVTLMQQKIPEAVFIVFSDDINWVKENWKFGGEVYFETEGNTIAQKVLLMSACKHFIIANSTFSWWMQYLGQADNKIVISPDRFFREKSDMRNELVTDTFTTIEVG